MTIKKVSDKNELEYIEKIEKTCFDDAWGIQMLEFEYSNNFSHMYIIYDEKEAAGYISYRELFESAEILRIAVMPEYRKKGLGMKLIDEMKNNLVTAQEILLEVDINNVPAIELYKKAGFDTLNVREKYYKHPDGTYTDAVNMRLILQ